MKCHKSYFSKQLRKEILFESLVIIAAEIRYTTRKQSVSARKLDAITTKRGFITRKLGIKLESKVLQLGN